MMVSKHLQANSSSLTDTQGFADFAGAPDPSPVPISPVTTTANVFGTNAQATLAPTIPYTKWYRVWERTQPSDFLQEAIILPFVFLVLAIHIWGLRANKRKAKDWARHHVPAIEFEYAKVGYEKGDTIKEKVDPESAIRANTSYEYVTYSTGRSNVAFTDFKLTLIKRYNPLVILGENIIGLLFEGIPPTVEQMEATSYTFDNKESEMIGARKGESAPKSGNSAYDGFVWAVVNKRMLKKLRDDRYDISLTTTKDHPKLPVWTTIMTESAEITDTMLTPELIKAITDAGDLFDALIVSDQPLERPSRYVGLLTP
jgi:hypothetical protein